MARSTPIINSFAGGEISPQLDARSDIQWYRSSCRRLENMIPRAQGGALRRGGTRYIAEVRDSAKRTALLPFEFSTQQAYVIEAGDLYFRFYKDKGQILSGGVPYEVASPYALAELFDADGRLRLKYTQSADVLYLVHPRYAPRKLSRTGHTAWTLTTIEFVDGPWLDENTMATTLVASAGSGSVTVTASAATGLNDNAGFKATDIGRLLRLRNGAGWSWLRITGFSDTTHVTAEVKGGTAPTAATAAWQMGLWSDSTGWPACVMFFEERLIFGGAALRPNRWDGSKSGDFENFTPGGDDDNAVAFTIASDQVNAIRWLAPANRLILGTLGAEFAAGGGSGDSITPSTVNVRLQTRHGVADMMPALVGSNAILFVQRQGRKLREIAFSFEADGYVSEDMTVRAEHLTRGGLVQLAWQQEPFGILWAVRADGRLLGFTYLRSQLVTAWHQHPLADCGAAEALASIPGVGASIPGGGDDQLWLIARRIVNGQTKRYVELLEPPLADTADPLDAFYVDAGLTFDGKVAATLTPGAGATLAGATGIGFTAGSAVFTSGDIGREIRYRVADDPQANPPVAAVEARAVITGYTSPTLVSATILGAFPGLATIAADAWRLSVAQISGLDHLTGRTVQILTDGAVHPPRLVTGGSVTLDYPATRVHAGLGYASSLLPVRFEAGAAEGTAQGKKKRVSKVTLRLHRSLGCKVGRPGSSQNGADHLDELPFRDYGGLMDTPPPLFTGDKDVTFRGNYDTAGDVLIVQDQPLPLTVLAAMPVLSVAEGG